MVRANNICIGTAFFHVEGHSLNLGKASYKEKLEAYYKCMIVFFASARKFHPEAKLVLFSNEKLPDSYTKLLDHYKVHQEILTSGDIKYCNKVDIENNFPGCLFTLDVIDYSNKKRELLDGCGSLMIFDSDCVFLNSIDGISSGIGGIDLKYSANHIENKQSRSSLSLIRHAMADKFCGPIIGPYYGGEFYGISVKLLDQIAGDIKNTVEYITSNKDTWGKFFTEEHILSIVYAMNEENIIDKRIIKRVWTTDTFHNIDGNEKEYKILHYPAEKNSFFQEIYDNIKNDTNLFENMLDEEVKEIALWPIKLRLNPPMLKKIKIMTKTKIKNFIKKFV